MNQELVVGKCVFNESAPILGFARHAAASGIVDTINKQAKYIEELETRIAELEEKLADKNETIQ